MFKTALIAAALAACAGTSLAQTAAATPSTTTPTAAVDVLDARAAVPAARAAAPFENYRRHSSVEVQPGSWRSANDNVNRIGGWRTYAREAQATGPAPGASAVSSGGPAPNTTVPTPPTPSTQQAAPATRPPAPAPSAPPHRH